MDQDFMKKDPHGGKKKKAMIALVAVTGGLALVSFLIFGRLSRDFFVFDANRASALNEVKVLRDQISDLNDQYGQRKKGIEDQLALRLKELENLNARFSQREADVASQQERVDEYETISKMLENVKADHLKALDAFKSISYKVVEERGVAANLRAGNNILVEKSENLQSELALLSQKKTTAEADLSGLNANIQSAKQEGSYLLTRVGEVRNKLSDVSTTLTNKIIKIESAKETITNLENEISEKRSEYETLDAKVILAKEAVKAKQREMSELRRNMSSFETEIELLRSQKEAADERLLKSKIEMDRITQQLQDLENRKQASESELIEMGQ